MKFAALALTLGITGLGGFALVNHNNGDFQAALGDVAPAVQTVVDTVQQRDVQEMILTETNEHVADVDCNTGEVRFLYIGDQEWLNGAEQARVITENAENDFQAGFMQMAINNGVNNVCGF